MSTDKNFLQNIKLEISRTLKLLPYERLVFHRILGILKSDSAYKILTDELEHGRDLRSSAISVLVNFPADGIVDTLLPCLEKNIYEIDAIRILSMLFERGTAGHLPEMRSYIESFREGAKNRHLISLAFDFLKKNGEGDDNTLDFLLAVINSGEYPPEAVFFAVRALSSFRNLSIYEKILSKKDDYLSLAVFNSINVMLISLTEEASEKIGDDDHLFTYSPESEDRLVLEIRVLLGKATSSFDGFSNRTKTALMAAMISCNHRECLTYIMKGLTSGGRELVRLTLYTVLFNVERMRDPDKLFRNLVALSTETAEDNDIIISIIVKYFRLPFNNRQFNILKDKMFGYFVVTLDTYFEMYRREFMIAEVSESSFPENFQRIRRFILANMTPDLKRKIVHFLLYEESNVAGQIIKEVGSWLTYIDESGREDLALLIEVMFEHDKKIREISAGRIEDINFEKRYLKKRIIRVCRLIAELQISDAASSLVNIYNYLKKYPEPGLMDEVVQTLASLNYSYMLGEVELSLTTGGFEEKERVLDLMSLFTEQRSLNILFDFVESAVKSEPGLVKKAVEVLLMRDIKGNLTALTLFKNIIENYSDNEAAPSAVLGIGLVGYESDISYLNSLFESTEASSLKEAAVRAIGSIISLSKNYDRRTVIKTLQNCLKDPGIRIRIYACLLLAKLGDRDALRYIRDMLVIKNKSIQRDILAILGNLESVEFSFFLLSLLKEEYGISRDIVSVFSRLPVEEMQEIDGFVVNIFRKYEAPDLEGFEQKRETSRDITVPGLSIKEKSLLRVEISGEGRGKSIIPELIGLELSIKEIIAGPVASHGGEICEISNRCVVSIFDETEKACRASLQISKLLKAYNSRRRRADRLRCAIKIFFGNMKVLNDELIDYPDYFINIPDEDHFYGRIISDSGSNEIAENNYNMFPLPHTLFGGSMEVYELITEKNYKAESEAIFEKIIEEEVKREESRQQLEEEMKRLKRHARAPSSVSLAGDIDAIGYKLRDHLDEIEKYVQRRATDRELIKNVKKMLDNVYNLYKVEVSRIKIE